MLETVAASAMNTATAKTGHSDPNISIYHGALLECETYNSPSSISAIHKLHHIGRITFASRRTLRKKFVQSRQFIRR